MKNYLNTSRNSMQREAIFKYALFHDIKLAAASLNSNLKIYEPEIDNEGCDIIIEDGRDFSRKIQLKSIYETTTQNWFIHKNILLPGRYEADIYGLDTILCPTYPNSFILIEANAAYDSSNKSSNTHYPKNNYTYYFTDINVILLIYLNIINKNPKTHNAATKVISNIGNQSFTGKLNIPKSLLIKTKGPLALLKLLGMCGNYDFIHNSTELIKILNRKDLYLKENLNNPLLFETLEEKNIVIDKRKDYLISHINNMLLEMSY